MATRFLKDPPPADVRCQECGHLEREHGTTGMRPCLQMIGELLEREFCACGHFRAEMVKAA